MPDASEQTKRRQAWHEPPGYWNWLLPNIALIAIIWPFVLPAIGAKPLSTWRFGVWMTLLTALSWIAAYWVFNHAYLAYRYQLYVSYFYLCPLALALGAAYHLAHTLIGPVPILSLILVALAVGISFAAMLRSQLRQFSLSKDTLIKSGCLNLVNGTYDPEAFHWLKGDEKLNQSCLLRVALRPALLALIGFLIWFAGNRDVVYVTFELVWAYLILFVQARYVAAGMQFYQWGKELGREIVIKPPVSVSSSQRDASSERDLLRKDLSQFIRQPQILFLFLIVFCLLFFVMNELIR